ncbi:MAG: DNA gyrase subunit A, partial [Actinobacteria bacterium]|nr:DNA gyrase subunit A [Actinomycetota bacterium]
ITDGGFAKRTPVSEWATKGRGILGVRAMRLTEARGSLVGAMVCEASDQIFAIASNGVVIRTKVEEIRPSGRDTMGVTLMNLTGDDTVVAVARSTETDDDEMPLEADVDAVADSAAEEASVGEEQP